MLYGKTSNTRISHSRHNSYCYLHLLKTYPNKHEAPLPILPTHQKRHTIIQ